MTVQDKVRRYTQISQKDKKACRTSSYSGIKADIIRIPATEIGEQPDAIRQNSTPMTMKKRLNSLDRGSALQITLSVALISVSAILLVVATPTNTKKTPRQVTAPGRSSRMTVRRIFTAASPTTTPVPCGKIAFVSNRDGNNEIYAMNADGSNQTRLTNNPAFDNGPSFGRDGSKIAFFSDRDGNYEIYVMNADGSNQTRLTSNTAFDFYPSFSGDGSKIAFGSHRDGNEEIYVMNADGSNQTRLTNNSAVDELPSFSGDGSKIAFGSNRDGNVEIYVMNADGSNQTRLTNNTAFDDGPSFSPDGSKIAFVSARDGGDEIYIMNADGSNQTRLTNNSPLVTDFYPSFGEDGSKIAFGSDRDGNFEIYVMNADGSNQTPLTNNPATDFSPSFGGCAASLIGLEVTQGVQDLNNSVQLVEHKKTFVRAHVKTLSADPISASASLTAKDTVTGATLGTIPNSNVGGQIRIPPGPHRSFLNDSFLFEVPFAWRTGTVEFSFAGNEVPFACEAGGDACSKVTVTFQPVDPLSMKFVSITYKDAAGIDHTPTGADVTRVMKEFLGRYPINFLDSVIEAKRSNFNACLGIPAFESMLKNLMICATVTAAAVPARSSIRDCWQIRRRAFISGLNGEGDLPGHASAVFVITH